MFVTSWKLRTKESAVEFSVSTGRDIVGLLDSEDDIVRQALASRNNVTSHKISISITAVRTTNPRHHSSSLPETVDLRWQKLYWGERPLLGQKVPQCCVNVIMCVCVCVCVWRMVQKIMQVVNNVKNEALWSKNLVLRPFWLGPRLLKCIWLHRVARYTEKCSLKDHQLASKPYEDRSAQYTLWSLHNWQVKTGRLSIHYGAYTTDR